MNFSIEIRNTVTHQYQRFDRNLAGKERLQKLSNLGIDILSCARNPQLR